MYISGPTFLIVSVIVTALVATLFIQKLRKEIRISWWIVAPLSIVVVGFWVFVGFVLLATFRGM